MRGYGHTFQLIVLLLMSILLAAGVITRPASAADNEKSYFWAEASPINEKVCPNREVILLYQLMFRGLDYERDMKRHGAVPLPALMHPTIKVTATNGKISGVKDLQDTYEGEPAYDEVFKSWSDTFYFTPEKPGSATVNLEAKYLGLVTRTKWIITVWEDCKYTVEISADESSFKMPSGKTVNEEQSSWSIKMFFDGIAKGVLADPLVNEGGDGGQKRVLSGTTPLSLVREDATGTIESFADGIWLGNEPDITCGTGGAFTCSETFTVHPVTNDETIEFQIDIESGQCSGFSVWCKGEGGGGEANIPPMKSLSFQMNAEIPREGGSTHYVHQLPHGVTMDYLISAYPEVEE